MNSQVSPVVVEKYHSEITTVPQVFALVGDDVCARWEKLGDLDSKIHWQYGQEAEALIAEGVPAMLVYKAIAIKSVKKSQTIRKSYYTFKAFTPEQRAKYELCPYSIFQIARTQEEPEKVLQEYINNRASVDEMEIVYPEIADKMFEAEFESRGYPRMFYSIYREIYLIDPFLKQRVIENLNEIEEIIKQVNK
jgi:hypothetical protein